MIVVCIICSLPPRVPWYYLLQTRLIFQGFIFGASGPEEHVFFFTSGFLVRHHHCFLRKFKISFLQSPWISGLTRSPKDAVLGRNWLKIIRKSSAVLLQTFFATEKSRWGFSELESITLLTGSLRSPDWIEKKMLSVEDHITWLLTERAQHQHQHQHRRRLPGNSRLSLLNNGNAQ